MTTFVLIHGSYQGGWIWQRVASRLRGAGHAVYAPTLDGCAERKHQVRAGITTETHATEIAEVLGLSKAGAGSRYGPSSLLPVSPPCSAGRGPKSPTGTAWSVTSARPATSVWC